MVGILYNPIFFNSAHKVSKKYLLRVFSQVFNFFCSLIFLDNLRRSYEIAYLARTFSICTVNNENIKYSHILLFLFAGTIVFISLFPFLLLLLPLIFVIVFELDFEFLAEL